MDKRSFFKLFGLTLVLHPIGAGVEAQIIPDGTLGNESAIVTPIDSITDRIDGGAIRGSNLFHSFREFNIKEGNAAYFANPAGIQTIFSRVTGSNPSRLFGTLGVLGNANLFFINPNGIIFGPNAQLSISGSFIGSTANSIIFSDGSRFSATNPNAAPLLTIDVPIPLGLEFEGGETGSIINSGQLETGQNLALVGGTVVNTGILSTFGNPVTVVTTSPNVRTTVYLDDAGSYLGETIQPLVEPPSISSTLSIAELVTHGGEGTSLTVDSTGVVRVIETDTPITSGDAAIIGALDTRGVFGGGAVTVTSQGDIHVSGGINASAFRRNATTAYQGNGGEVNLIAQGDILGSSSVLAQGILGGNITLNSGGTVSLSNGLEVNVRSGGEGNITITARNVEMLGNSKLRAGIDVGLGSPDAVGGDIVINATESVTLDGGSFIANVLNTDATGKIGDITITTGLLSLNNAVLNARTFEGSEGNAGNINIMADTASLQNDSQLTSSTSGIGDAGNININTRTTQINNSLLRSRVDRITDEQGNVRAVGKGNGGVINITTGSLILSNGVQLDSSTLGQGNAGDININANQTVLLDNSAIFSDVDNTAIGNAGDINITTGTFTLQSSQLIADTEGRGNAGNITLDTQNKIALDGSAIFTNINENGTGKGGDITINTGDLSLTNRSQLIAGVEEGGEGEAGTIRIEARNDVSLIEVKPLNRQDTINTGIINRLFEGGKGKAGDIYITTGSLLLDGAVIQSITDGEGDAGDIYINARETITLINQQQAQVSSIASSVGTNGKGNGGGINITTGQLYIDGQDNLVGIISSTGGRGNAGNISIKANEAIILNNGVLISSNVVASDKDDIIQFVGTGNGGNIDISTGTLSLNNIAGIITNTEGRGNAGNITVNARETVILDNSELNSAVLKDAIGSSGNIEISTDRLSLNNKGELVTETQGHGNAGNITVNARETVILNDSLLNSTVRKGAIGLGGNITIDAKAVFLENDSFVISGTLGTGKAGSITINVSDALSLDSSTLSSDVLSKEAIGNAGDITLSAESVLLQNNSSVLTGTVGGGDAGIITVNARDSINLHDNSFLTTQVAPTGIGTGGDIIIKSRTISLQNSSSLATVTRGTGNAGNIFINAIDSVTLVKGSLLSTTVFKDSIGDGGDIYLDTKLVTLQSSGLFTATSGTGNAGDVQIKNAELISLDDSAINAEVQSEATTQPSNIELNTQKLSLVNNSIITADTFGVGEAGNVTVRAGEINLNQSTISTRAASLNGGNITLNFQNLLTLQNNSQISTTAGTAQAGGDGGNITINSPFIVTSPFENSDITANAFTGRGGNINITTLGIFGLEVRDALTPFSDITASSAFGLSGNINIDNLGIDPTRGIESLPQEVVNSQVFRGCQVREGEAISEFYRLGRGGIPSSPDELWDVEPFSGEGFLPLEIPINPIPLQNNWQEIPSNSVFLSCPRSVL